MTYRNPDDVVFTEMAGTGGREGVLLNIRTRRYYSLNETGLVLYERLIAGDTVDRAAAHLTTLYAVDIAQALASASRLVSELASAGLLVAETPPA